MPLPTLPTTQEIRDRIITDIESQIGQTTPSFYKAFNRVLATALALVYVIIYKYGCWAYQQIFTVTQDDESLERKGAQYGIARVAATTARLTANVTGTIGQFIPEGTTYRGSVNGLIYAVETTVEFITGSAVITINCLTPGAAGNLLVGGTLTIMSPIPSVDNSATVASVLTTAADRESLEAYRTRISDFEKRPPQGGALTDYILWAREVAGVTRAFAWGKREVGSITQGYVCVYPLTDNYASRIPDSAKLAEVLAYIDSPSRAPCQAVAIEVLAMTERTFTVTFSALSPNTADIRSAITANITSFLLSREPKQFLDQLDVRNVISRSMIEAVCIESGAEYMTLALCINGNASPIESHTLAYNELCKLSSVTFP